MKIEKILNQHRRDFTAIYVCEHCGHKEKGSGYDDSYFHQNVIPEKICSQCNKKSPYNYRPLSTKYSKSTVV